MLQAASPETSNSELEGNYAKEQFSQIVAMKCFPSWCWSCTKYFSYFVVKRHSSWLLLPDLSFSSFFVCLVASLVCFPSVETDESIVTFNVPATKWSPGSRLVYAENDYIYFGWDYAERIKSAQMHTTLASISSSLNSEKLTLQSIYYINPRGTHNVVQDLEN